PCQRRWPSNLAPKRRNVGANSHISRPQHCVMWQNRRQDLCAFSTRQRYVRCPMPLDDATRTELEAAAFRTLVQHLRERTDVQNIDLMNLAGFCRNCLSNWLKDAADAKGVSLTKDESREAIYGMPYETWKATHQGSASAEQLAAMKKAQSGH